MNCTKSMSLSRLTKLPTILPQFVKNTMSLLVWKKLEFWMLEIKHEKINKNQEEIIQGNLEYNTHLELSNGSKDKSLPIMYWIPILHKNPAVFGS